MEMMNQSLGTCPKFGVHFSYRITGCVYEVYRHLGCGFLESVYQRALVHELRAAGLAVESEAAVTINYKGQPLAEHRLDLLVENRIIVELKAQQKVPFAAESQLINYLKATGLKLGLLVNFAFPKATVKRIIY
ncbi:GxxExxY protein [Marinobacter sp. P4B1]|uniref:GxxExxY protein n=1 Tax=Marinobacter sp. P4B1 TaxID=1119533 RepID=UPI001D0CE7ED|nr:GxxExxY protein [Marinobacter sp. P4B1]